MRRMDFSTCVTSVAAMFAAGCVAWFGFQGTEVQLDRIAEIGELRERDGPGVEAIEIAAERRSIEWREPEAKKEWDYDLFTPPEIYFDEATRTFAVVAERQQAIERLTGEAEKHQERRTETMGPVKLVAVERALFRLQLLGFAGEEGEARGIFQNVATSEVFSGRSGVEVESLGLAIEEFSLQRVPVHLAESMTVSRRVGRAVVRDRQTGERVELSSLGRRESNELVAWVRCNDTAQVRAVRVGETIETAGASYAVEAIQVAPATLRIRRCAGEAMTVDVQILSVEPPVETMASASDF